MKYFYFTLLFAGAAAATIVDTVDTLLAEMIIPAYNPLHKAVETVTQSGHIRQAIIDNNIDLIKKLVENDGMDLNTLNGSHPPLHLAIIFKSDDIAYLLIDAGANIEQLDSQNESPLEQAIGCNNYGVTRALLSAGASPIKKVAWKGYTIANIFVKANVLWGNTTLAQDYIFDVDDILKVVSLGMNHLQFHLKSYKLLNNEVTRQEWYALVNQQDELGATCLMYAATLGDVEMTEWLLNHGANPLVKVCGKTIFEFLDYILKHTTLSEQQRADYLKILRLCVQRLDNRFLRLIQRRVFSESGHLLHNDLRYVILDYVTKGSVATYNLHPVRQQSPQQTNTNTQIIVYQEQDSNMFKEAWMVAFLAATIKMNNIKHLS
jgi:ankyrin repeat protein